ncbi:MAG: hypothetical protein LUD02_01370 [Tannerellaceae bacterium]|nr:hypothetical protein [Tannerellaceae bacterium]MCD8262952.1 hypothetical protein [Tannerellaceae bacterium]
MEIDLETNQPEKRFVYSGTYAEINDDFNHKLATSIPYALKESSLRLLYKASPHEYRAYWMKTYYEAVEMNNAMEGVSEGARKLANCSVAFMTIVNLKSFKYAQQYMAMVMEGVERIKTFKMFEDLIVPEEFYDVLPEFPLNDPVAVFCYNFGDGLFMFVDALKPTFFMKIMYWSISR